MNYSYTTNCPRCKRDFEILSEFRSEVFVIQFFKTGLCQECLNKENKMKYEDYVKCFKDEDGKWIDETDVSPCCFCTKEKFQECLERDLDCEDYKKYVENG